MEFWKVKRGTGLIKLTYGHTRQISIKIGHGQDYRHNFITSVRRVVDKMVEENTCETIENNNIVIVGNRTNWMRIVLLFFFTH